MGAMERYTIVSIIDSFEFPLREALRKQIWWLALRKKNQGYTVDIVILTNGVTPEKRFSKKEISITLKNKYRSLFAVIRTDILHVVTAIVAPKLFFIRGGRLRKLTLTDGDVFHGSQPTARRLLARFLPIVFHEIQVFSHFQQTALNFIKTRIVEPILPVQIHVKRSLHKDPTLLFMGHLSRSKGVDTILLTLPQLISDFPSIRLILADNGVQHDTDMEKMIADYETRFPNNIIRKGVVDPETELAECWIYLYPFKKPGGTMAYALSLCESHRAGTPYIACNVGANPEFFPKNNLINPGDHHTLTTRIRDIINDTIKR